MEYEKIKQLIKDMGDSNLTALDIEFPDGTKVKMKKEEKPIIPVGKKTEKCINTDDILVEQQTNVNLNNQQEKIQDGNIVKSPMVGTFYAKSSPNSEPYVQVGQMVKKGDVLCIIEAMKLMNEIESEFDGKIQEILVKDGETVEYGKPLFIIK